MTSTSILITGAGSGIGAATAQALAGPGRQMLLHTKSNRAGLESIAAEVEARGSRTVLALGDLADAATGSRLVEAAVAAFGGLEILGRLLVDLLHVLLLLVQLVDELILVGDLVVQVADLVILGRLVLLNLQ